MARAKNALRGHFIGVWDPVNPTKKPTAWLELAHYIQTITDDTDEETDDTGFYDGDGTPEETVTSVKGSYTFEGFYDPTDLAQKLLADMKFEIGDGRRVWHKVVSSDNTKQWIQVANASEIVAGDGDATSFEAFKAKLSWIKLPEESAVTP
ncbi:major tail shaft protein [Pseudolactococcus yaeyamensis]